jgi:hypothetical protein
VLVHISLSREDKTLIWFYAGQSAKSGRLNHLRRLEEDVLLITVVLREAEFP